MINTSSEEILKLIFDGNEYFQQIFDKNRTSISSKAEKE